MNRKVEIEWPSKQSISRCYIVADDAGVVSFVLKIQQITICVMVSSPIKEYSHLSNQKAGNKSLDII